MTEKHKKQPPPYATFPSFINFFNRLRETGIPNRIDPSVFGNASGSLIYSMLSSLKSLNLISEDGMPSAEFKEFVIAKDTERPELLKKIIERGYPTLFNSDLDLTNITAKQFNDHFREEHDVAGSTIDKIATFFLAAAKFAKIPISKHLENRTPIASSPSSKKSPKQRKNKESNGQNQPPPKLTDPSQITETALEYRLVDLMSEAADNPEVMNAIIAVITFLKTKDIPTKDTNTEEES